MTCTVFKNHFTCNIFIRVVILKDVEQEQLWASWEAGELNRQPAEVNFTEAFLFSTFFTLPFLLHLFARNMEDMFQGIYQVKNLK